MAELFQATKQNISLHIRNILAEGELSAAATVKEYLTVQTEGDRQIQRSITAYRLEMVLAVGYRVRSPRGTQFRRWATTVLQEYLVKGFVLDDARLKEPAGAIDYFDELLERIREIRASEKRFYQKVRDLFTTAADYDGKDATARLFYQTIQNKLLWAVTHQTAAELIVARADAGKPNMGLLTFAGARVRKVDGAIAKNYLNEDEMRELNRLVSAFLELAEDRARRRQQTTMAEWVTFVDNYLKLAEREVLTHAGRVRHDDMLKLIDQRYASFNTTRQTAEREAADIAHEREIDAELRQIENAAGKAKRAAAYPAYKTSGIEWLGDVPEHWEVRRLKRACDVFPSNVDKKSQDGEPFVKLCNYTDVYYNETITSGIEFMVATASFDQIDKFTLRAGDTIITKDSESADDIAIGAYVPADLPGVVCGYHLSMVRPMTGFDGAFVKRLFESRYAKACFAILANGLTRVGLGQYELDNIELPFPPLAEQSAIAAFLDRETGKIDALVAEQERLMALLKEKRQAVISHAVTKGLDPNVPMQHSGVEWLGEVPAHWTVKPIRMIANVDLRFGLPPLAEQQEIIDQIAQISTQFDTLKNEAIRAIALLKERRAALISAAVTGKIDVRGLVDTKAQAA
eukprot:gene5928-5997_t